MSTPPLTTPLTTLLRIQHPILLAGMAHTSTAALAAAVSSAGGLGTIGGLGYSPSQLRAMIHELKALLISPSLPFGVDLALPKVGAGARATNHDYTHGQLDALVDVIVEEGAALFVSAVGIPPESVVRRLHEGEVVVMNMVGAPRHAEKAFEVGCDIVCAQGGEGGGHTGDIASSILVPACVDVAKRYRPPMLGGRQGLVVAAGGIFDGRGLAGALMQGAVGVWVGTRFVASEEAGCSRMHKEAVVGADFNDTLKTLVVSGRPLRVRRNDYVDEWERRPEDIRRLTETGIVPMMKDMEEDKEVDMPYLMGQVAAVVGDIKPAKSIVEDMVNEAVYMLRVGQAYMVPQRDSKL
ncbi:hypothetical protein MMC15_002820 [Xylographa vitiligo]|nr:hypothetical protein [Xylographa vitiligo]